MNGAHETMGIVEGGNVKLPPGVQLPDGTAVRISWGEAEPRSGTPYDRRALTEEDVRRDVAWAKESRTT